MSDGPFGISGPPGESGIIESYKLPCDVRLPPNTTIKKGCNLETLMVALRARDGKNATFHQPAPLEIDGILHASTCACFHTPSLRAIRSACSCGAIANQQGARDSK